MKCFDYKTFGEKKQWARAGRERGQMHKDVYLKNGRQKKKSKQMLVQLRNDHRD